VGKEGRRYEKIALASALTMSSFAAQPARADGGVILGVILVTGAVLWLSKKAAPPPPVAKPRRAKKK
jgi:hypothetical protein